MFSSEKVFQIGHKVIDVCYSLLMIFFLLLGGYSLWDMHMIGVSAFVSDELLQYKPGEDNQPLTLDDLNQKNEDVKAWLTINNTHIDYPVVQGENDLEYVNLDVFRDFSVSGSVFLCSENNPDFSDSYQLLYGHHMENGAMFGDVDLFLDQDFLMNNHSGQLTTLTGKQYQIELFATVQTDAYDEWIFYNPKNITSENMMQFLMYVKQHSVSQRQIELSANEQIIALATCTDYQTNARNVLLGRLISK